MALRSRFIENRNIKKKKKEMEKIEQTTETGKKIEVQAIRTYHSLSTWIKLIQLSRVVQRSRRIFYVFFLRFAIPFTRKKNRRKRKRNITCASKRKKKMTGKYSNPHVKRNFRFSPSECCNFQLDLILITYTHETG